MGVPPVLIHFRLGFSLKKSPSSDKWFMVDITLVGGFNPSEKHDFVSWDYEIPN